MRRKWYGVYGIGIGLFLAIMGCSDGESTSSLDVNVADVEDVSDAEVQESDGLSEDSEVVSNIELIGNPTDIEEEELPDEDSGSSPVDGQEEEIEPECTATDECDDGNPCSKGLCIGGTCEFIPVSVFCDDNSLCTLDDICVGLECVGDSVNCDDSDPCTLDSCDHDLGCVYEVEEEACYEEAPCEGESCDDPCLNGDEEGCAALDNIAQVAAGGQFTCARTEGGDVWCWGSNTLGQLGNGSTLTYIVPSKVIGVYGATDLSAGFGHACAVVSDGEVRCWGGNNWGQLGDGTTTGSLATSVSSLTDVVQVGAGTAHTCALEASGRVYCWGQGTFGQLGNGEAKTVTTPVEVEGLSSASRIAVGGHHACAIFGGGYLSCWGYNASGQLGNVSVAGIEVTPSPVFDQTKCSWVDAFADTTCGVATTGTVHCWGSNSSGKLGIAAADVPGSIVPVEIDGLGDSSSVAVGEQHVCVLQEDGIVSCWGQNDFVVDLPAESATQPTHISSLVGISQMTSGQQHMCVLGEEGLFACWGTNVNGQLGNGGKVSSVAPTAVVGLP